MQQQAKVEHYMQPQSKLKPQNMAENHAGTGDDCDLSIVVKVSETFFTVSPLAAT